MTTIAIKDGVVAADTRQAGNYIDPVSCKKIKKVKCIFEQFNSQEVIVTGAGNLADVMWFMDWIEQDGQKDTYKPPEESTFILVNKEGIWEFQNYYKPMFCGTIGAFGSGGRYAMGAMYAGASAVEAVEIASRLDPDTGGEIMILELEK